MTYCKDLIASLIRDVPDFPEPGVTFKDITPLPVSYTHLTLPTIYSV